MESYTLQAYYYICKNERPVYHVRITQIAEISIDSKSVKLTADVI